MKTGNPAIRISRLLTMVTLLGLGLVSIACRAETRSPNVIVIISDDQGWGDLGYTGNTSVSTPHLNRLAAEGAVLDHFYVSPLCSLTRSEVLTGRYHTRTGVNGVQAGQERLNPDERTIADAFKAAGYATALFGKWHNGSQWPYHPNARGFDEFLGYSQGHWPMYFDVPIEHNGQRVTIQGYLPDELTHRMLAFIDGHREAPFLCILSMPTPHEPLQVPDQYWERFAGKERLQKGSPPAGNKEDPAFTRAVLAMAENIDDNVGRVLTRLDELKLRENTIVVYLSDNGPNNWRWNGGLKGRKGSTDEGGVRSPGVINWPRHIAAASRITEITGAIDLLPTLTDLAGVKPIVGKPLDGVSLRPLLLPESGQPRWPARLLFAESAGKTSVRSDQYRLDARGELFDLMADPGQTTNIADRNPALAARLTQEIAAWKNSLPPAAPRTEPRSPVGYAAMPRTELIVGEINPHGNIRRSSRWANSSYFLNWTSPEDRITWPIEVVTAGRYRAEIYYTCPSRDLGSLVELAVNSQAITATLLEPNDPPARGAKEDRVVREESYSKDFKPFVVGTIELPAGPAELTLRALKIPGTQVMEVQAVALTLLP